MKKFILSISIFFVFTATALPAMAQTAASAEEIIKQLQEQIQLLKTQMEALQKAQSAVQQTSKDIGATLRILGQLRQGMTGEEVKLLQIALAADSEVYPEGLITGYYGKLTANAVKKFQKKHNLEQVGNVGPKTLKKLNEFFDENPVSKENRAGVEEHCAIVPPGHLIAPGWLKKNDRVKPVVPACQVLPPGIAKIISATTTPPTASPGKDVVSPVVSSTTVSGSTTPAPDTTPPVISWVVTSNTTDTGTTVIWATNEASNSKVYYATTSPLNFAAAGLVSDNSFVTSHSVTLTSLSKDTNYYIAVESSDAAGNVATSSQQSFATSGVDTTAPTISAVAASNITANGATISWLTNEPATSKVYYNSGSSISFSTAGVVNDVSLVTNHLLDLSGLSANATYYFAVRSLDAASNATTSAEYSFTTLP